MRKNYVEQTEGASPSDPVIAITSVNAPCNRTMHTNRTIVDEPTKTETNMPTRMVIGKCGAQLPLAFYVKQDVKLITEMEFLKSILLTPREEVQVDGKPYSPWAKATTANDEEETDSVDKDAGEEAELKYVTEFLEKGDTVVRFKRRRLEAFDMNGRVKTIKEHPTNYTRQLKAFESFLAPYEGVSIRFYVHL